MDAVQKAGYIVLVLLLTILGLSFYISKSVSDMNDMINVATDTVDLNDSLMISNNSSLNLS